MMSRIRIDVTLALFALCLVLAVASVPAYAQQTDDESQSGQATDAEETPDASAAAAEDEQTRKERKQQAKEERIQEYLRKREERRAKKEMSREEGDATGREEQAREMEVEQLAASEAAPAAVPQTKATDVSAKAMKKSGIGKKGGAPSRLPRALARAQANVRASKLGADPTVQEYLDLIDEQGASPQQLAAFGSFIAQNGLLKDGLEYYNVAIHLDADDPVLWVNAGTLQMQSHDLTAAASAFSRALSIDPNHAVAHYNLGATLDEMDRYEDAVLEYKVALTIDPSLGDPQTNPQAANNDLLLAVKLMLYQEQMGSLSVPLLDVSTGKLQGAAESQ